MIRAEGVVVRYPRAERAAVSGVGLSVGPGELLAVVGPNGSGKSTLLRAVLGAVPLAAGRVWLAGRELAEWSPRERARLVGAVAQREEQRFVLTVRETVALGRYAHLGPLDPEREVDRQAIRDALDRVDMAAMADRRTDTLSGGEWQRVRIARALAQAPRALVLDEPTAALDIRHEMELFELVRELAGQGIAVLLSTHELNLSARFADRLLLLHQGRLAAEGEPERVLEPARLATVFEWPVGIARAPEGGPQVVPLRSGAAP